MLIFLQGPGRQDCVSGDIKYAKIEKERYVSNPIQVADDGVVLDPPRRCDDEPLNNDCQMNASLRRSSISFSVHSRVGKACKNIITS